MRKMILVSLFCLSACQAAGPFAAQKPDPCPLTKLDTRKQEELCHHFAGEDPYDAARKAYIEKQLRDLNCGLFF